MPAIAGKLPLANCHWQIAAAAIVEREKEREREREGGQAAKLSAQANVRSQNQGPCR